MTEGVRQEMQSLTTTGEHCDWLISTSEKALITFPQSFPKSSWISTEGRQRLILLDHSQPPFLLTQQSLFYNRVDNKPHIKDVTDAQFAKNLPPSLPNPKVYLGVHKSLKLVPF
jgi:hypothetical protein